MTRLINHIKDWVPPVLLPVGRKLLGKEISFYGNYSTFEEAASQSLGYDSSAILEKVLEATLKVYRGEAAFERDSVAFNEIDYNWPLTAGLMWAAARSGGRLGVVDFGGALGSSYFQNRLFLSGLPEVCWSVVEQKNYVEAGRKYIKSDILSFHETIESCLIDKSPNLFLLSSVLQYLPDPYNVIRLINKSNASFLIVDRTTLSPVSNDSICIQKVPESIYKASYPAWIFSEERLLSSFDGWKIVATTKGPEPEYKTKAGLTISFSGFIMER